MPSKLFASVQFTTKTRPTPMIFWFWTRPAINATPVPLKGTLRQQSNIRATHMFSLAKINRKCKGVLSLRLRQCHSCQEPISCTLMHESRFSDPDTFFFLISPSSPKQLRDGAPELRYSLTPPRNSARRRTTPVAPGAPVGWPSAAIRVFPLASPSSPKQLGMVSPELRRHWATIARLGVIVAITVEVYYAQGEAVRAAVPRKNAWCPPVGAPVPRSSGLANRFR